jgi:hypothetical protein
MVFGGGRSVQIDSVWPAVWRRVTCNRDLAWALECIGIRGPCTGGWFARSRQLGVVFVESWERSARLIRFGVFPAVERRRAHAPSPSASGDGRPCLWLLGPALGDRW